MIDNHDIAILTKLNELAERHGIKPYDFSASAGYNSDDDTTKLRFETVSDAASEKVDAMLDAIAGQGGMPGGTLSGSPKDIIDALDQALAKAPRPRIK